MLVSQILKSKSDDGVVTIAPDATVAEVLDHLAEGHPQAVPITEDGRLIGLVTRSDLIALLAARLRDG